MIIDSHVHIGRRFDRRLTEYIQGGNFKMLGEQVIEDMDKAGIDMGITFGLLDLDTEYQAEIQKVHPDRLVSCAWIDPHKKGALDEFRRGVEVLGIRGLKLHGWWQQYSLADHPLLDPFVEICEKNHLSVIVHGMGDNCMTTPLQLENLAKAFPKVNFVLGHGGNLWLGDEGILVTKRNDNIFVDTAYMQSYWIKRFVEEVGAHKVCMGSDYPWYYLESTVQHIRDVLENPVDREWVMGRSIATVFDIPWK